MTRERVEVNAHTPGWGFTSSHGKGRGSNKIKKDVKAREVGL